MKNYKLWSLNYIYFYKSYPFQYSNINKTIIAIASSNILITFPYKKEFTFFMSKIAIIKPEFNQNEIV